jgi:hypothetical protein
MKLVLAVLATLAVACGSPRRVVVEPSAVPGLKGDTWHVTGEPASPAPGHEDPAAAPR